MSLATTVTLVRHGTTDANTSGVFLGQTDVALNIDGLAEARRAAAALARDPIDQIWSSDLRRAHDTASAIAAAHPAELSVRLEPRLREIHLGEFEMVDVAGARRSHPDLMAQWRDDPGNARMPGAEAETLQEVQDRAWACVQEVVASAPGGHVVLVSHTFCLLSLVCRVLDIPLDRFRRFWLDRASISRLRFGRAGAAIVSLNGTAHLAGGDDDLSS